VAPLIAFLVLPAWWWVAPACIAILVVARHHENITRLLAGTEPGMRPGTAKPAAGME
jgi:glycerol-3-phosphate acyltransferase PlsY